VWCFIDNDDQTANGIEDDATVGLGSNSPLTSWADSAPTVQCGSAQSFVRTWGSNSLCGGGFIFVTQAIFIVDTVAPTLCVPEDLTFECPAVQPNVASNSVMDNFFGSPDVIDYCFPLDDSDINQVAVLNGNVITRTFSVTDGCTPVSGQQFITLADTTPPILERLPNLILECGAAISNTPPNVFDVCFLSTAPVATLSDTTFLGDCAGSYTIERTWTTTDTAGNTVQETQTIVVEDTTPPVIVLTAGGGAVIPQIVEVFTVNCFSDIVLNRFTQSDACSGVAQAIVPYEISLSHNENEGRTEVLVRYTSADLCGNSQTWADLWQVDSGLGVFSDVISGPTQPVSKGTTFTITVDITSTNACAPFGLLVVDAGFASLVDAGSSTCFEQSATGLIYCDPVPGASPSTLTLNLTVPTTFLGSDLIISVSWHYNYRTIGVLVGSYVVSFN
jgi:hypothetical protein